MKTYYTMLSNDPKTKEAIALLHMFGYTHYFTSFNGEYLRIKTLGKIYYYSSVPDEASTLSELLDVLINQEGD